jgi:hypothetical protein
MNLIRTAFTTFCLLLSIVVCQACSCNRLYFCEYLKDPEKKIVIKAKVGTYKEYSPENTALYLEVLDVFRDDVGITPVIKLYGSTTCCLCHLHFQNRFIKGSTIYLAVGLEYNGHDAGNHIVNPDGPYEDYWEFFPSSCLTVVLTTEEGRIKGPIAEYVTEYPMTVFDEKLENCDYSLSELQEYQCADEDYIVSPNPSQDGMITIRNSYDFSAIENIQIFDTSGRLVYSREFESTPFQRTQIEFQDKGLFIIAFRCSQSTFYKKFIVQ